MSASSARLPWPLKTPLRVIALAGIVLWGGAGMKASEVASPQNSGAKAPVPPALIPPLTTRGLRVVVDTTKAPECAAWAAQAKAMVELWYPVVAAYLDAPHEGKSTQVTLVFKDMKGVAHTRGNEITIASSWIAKHPEDLGMVLHELVHVVQGYPPSQAGWLVEGIADYIRFWMAEPAGQPKVIQRSSDHYRKGYRTTGAFLAWIEKHYSVPVIREANSALRRGSYEDALFAKLTGKDLDTLWAEFVAARSLEPGG
jgi:hypothetical protein